MSINHKLNKKFLEELKTLAKQTEITGGKIWFTLAEFIITGTDVPITVADKIFKNFIIPLSIIREKMGIPIYCSNRSGYRPKWWEWLNGRKGTSEHTFEGKGATDLTCENMKLLLHYLKNNSPFTRICYYPHHNFVHVDYKEENRRRYWEADENGKWIFKHSL